MIKNVGSIDRIVRILGAVIIAGVLFTGTVAISSTLGIILAVAGTIFLLTGAVSSCPLYSILGLSTCPLDSSKGR